MDRHDGTNARGPESGGIEEVERELEEDLDDPATYLRHLCDQPEPLRRDEIRDLAESILEERATLRAELEAVRRERDEWKAKHDTLADVSRACIATTERERDEARANYAFMVKRAADQKLDGYRELGARAAAAEERAERAERERDEARAELRRLALLGLERDERMNEALSGEADAVRRAESAELGCEIAYQREPTQAEGDAHDDDTGECFVAMGGWTGRRCRVCNRWTWGGPTACVPCVARLEHDTRSERIGKAVIAWVGDDNSAQLRTYASDLEADQWPVGADLIRAIAAAMEDSDD